MGYLVDIEVRILCNVEQEDKVMGPDEICQLIYERYGEYLRG